MLGNLCTGQGKSQRIFFQIFGANPANVIYQKHQTCITYVVQM